MKIKTPEQNVVDTLKGKRVLFIENDNGLYNGLEVFEDILKRNGIEYTVIFDASEVPVDQIIDAIHSHDAIVFMTQWVYPVAKKLHGYISALKDKKIVVEVYLGEPTWYYKPDVVHDVYIYSCMSMDEFDKSNEKFYMLSRKAYWDYKNKFNK